MRSSSWPRHLAGFTSMVVGASVVLGTVVWLNERAANADRDVGEREVAFDVAPERPKPPPSAPKPPPPRERRKEAPRAPMLTASLAGLSFGLPDYDGGLADMAQALAGDVQDVVMTEESVDVPPRPTRRAPAEYPSRARARDIEGYVVVSLLITADGVVREARVLEAQPSGVFEESALASVREWHFEPASYQGRSVTVRARQTLRFELQ